MLCFGCCIGVIVLMYRFIHFEQKWFYNDIAYTCDVTDRSISSDRRIS